MKSSLSYNDRMHRIGRIFMTIGLIIMLMVPIIIWLASGVGPDFNKLAISVMTLSLLYLPGGIIEVITYAPFLGTGATYLAFITGNLANLKIPCVINASGIVKTEIGTEENEVVATLSVAASTITTVVIMALGIILLLPLKPLLQSPILQPAFNWVVSALFGALGYKYFLRNPKFIPAPLLFVTLLAIFIPKFITGNIAIVIVLAAIVSVIFAKILHAKKML